MRYKLLFIISMVMITTYLSLTQAGMVMDGLIANWSFDAATSGGNTVKDLAGNYDATKKGDPKTVPGKFNEAIEFNGKDNYLELTTLKGFGSKLGTFSIDFWLKTPSTPDWTTLFKTLTDGASMGWAVDLNRTAQPGFAYAKGNTHFYVRDADNKQLPSEITENIYDNAWHHIGWVVEDASSNTGVIYIDGKAVPVAYGAVQTPVRYEDFQHPVYLGAANNRGNIERFCPAVVDEFRIYNKALNANQILQNMSSGAAVESVGKLSVTWGLLK